jgi:STE24 endopeptidase
MQLRFFADPDSLLHTFSPLLLFVTFALLSLFYFRIVYGYFSRLFERQADLHVFHLGLPHEWMTGALNSVALISGEPHEKPNWHHHSIGDRIRYLNAAANNPALISGHHARVKRILITYFTVLIGAALFFVGSTLPNAPQWHQSVITYVETSINTPLKEVIIQEMIDRYPLEGDEETVRRVIKETLDTHEDVLYPGVIEFYAAQYLFREQLYKASLSMMKHAWIRYGLTSSDGEVIEDFDKVTNLILLETSDNTAYHAESRELIHTVLDIKSSLREP